MADSKNTTIDFSRIRAGLAASAEGSNHAPKTTTTTKMNTEKTYQSKNYPGLHATENAWRCIGYYIVSNPQDWISNEAHARNETPGIPSDIVCLALGLHGQTDAALYWAAQEWQRRKEEQTRSAAEARSAESIAALAVALRSAGQQTALEQVIGRLSERTQYAVRAQLKGSSFAV